MYLGVGFVAVLILVLMSPVIWIAWWLLADLGRAGNGVHGAMRHETEGPSRRQAA